MKRFVKAIAMIHSEYIKGIVYAVLGKAQREFFTAPSSSSGKYHPEDEINEGGLVLHTLRVVKMADELAGLPWNWEVLQIENYSGYDVLIASAILHDCCKSGKGNWGKHTVAEHPLLAAELVLEVCGKNRITRGIANTIASHMGCSHKDRDWNKAGLPVPKTLCQKLLHEADYLASRKAFSITIE